MLVWTDAQLSPALAPWLAEQFGDEVYSVRFLGMRDASDAEIFNAARGAGATVLTKDRDFVRLLDVHGPPPNVVLLTVGNTSNARLRVVLSALYLPARELIESGDALVEIGERI